MADDAILRETKQRIDSLFAQVSGGASSASKGLYDVSRAAGRAESGLGDLASGTARAGRAASGFVTAVSTMESAADGYSTSLSATAQKLKDSVGFTTNSITESVEHIAGGIGIGAGALSQSVAGAVGGIKKFTEVFKTGKFAAAFGGLAKSVGLGRIAMMGLGATTLALEDYIDDSYKTWKVMSQAGMTLSGDLAKVGGMAGRTRMDMAEFGMAMVQGSKVMAKFGGMADMGAETMVDMQEAMMSTVEGYADSGQSYSKTMKMMGVAPKESMNLLTELMGDQVFASKLRGMQEGQDAIKRSEITAEYIAQLDQLSKLTGKSRETLAKEMKQKAQDAQFSATLLDMDADQAAAAKAQLAFVENTYGKDASELFKARLAGVVPVGDAARKLMSTSLGGVISDMAGETASAGGSAAADILESYMGDLGQAAMETRDLLLPLAKAGGLVGASFGNLYTATNEATLKNQAILEAMGKEITAMDKLTTAITEARNKTLGVYVEGGQRVYDDATRLLQSKAMMEQLVDLAGTAVHELITGYGRGGAKSLMPMSGEALKLGTRGYETILSSIEHLLMMRIEAPAVNDGSYGGGHGGNFYSFDTVFENLRDLFTARPGMSQEDLTEALEKRDLGNAVLNGAIPAEAAIRKIKEELAATGNANLDAGAAVATLVNERALELTGMTQAEMDKARAGRGPRQQLSTRQVTDQVIQSYGVARAEAIANAKTTKEVTQSQGIASADGAKNDIASQQLSTSKEQLAILNRQLIIMERGNNGGSDNLAKTKGDVTIGPGDFLMAESRQALGNDTYT